ncbi:type II toxin-antitoxin system Phd/YefM family antitoxin [Candidatus Peregrinibacteria bacterium]|nr:type II toxin-antitoxin system Phd/YefM family antitoxin [Candidatus Peregrinibacteria bacterium]
MRTLSVSQARANLYKIVKASGTGQVPIQVIGKNGSIVIITKDDWDAVQETLYLLSIPGMRQSIQKGLKTSLDECSDTLEW